MSSAATRMLVRFSDAYRGVLVVFLNAIGPRAAYALMAILARWLYRLFDPVRVLSEEQCRAALGGRYGPQETRRIAERAFVQRAWNLADLMLARGYLRRGTFRRYGGTIPEPYLGLLRAAQRRRQPVILITAYYGPFDLLPLLLGYNGIRAGAVYRPHGNPRFDKFRNSVRAGSGSEMIPVAQAVSRLPQLLGAGGTVAILSDHPATERGVPVTFLGRATHASRSIGVLAEHYDAVVTVAGIRRQPRPFHFDFVVTDLFDASAWRGADDPVAWITARYMAALERLVLSDPTQYLWAHARWASPPARLSTAAVG